MGTLAYDARGRLTSAGGTTYSYDDEGNLTGITQGGGTTAFTVDINAPLSRVLIRKEADDTYTYYIYGLGLIAEEKGAGEASQYRTYHYDYRGSTIALTDGSGATTDTFSYDVWGKTITHTGTNNTPFKYDGRDTVITDNTGLISMRARFYNPEIRRFVNMDPLLGSIVDGQSLNRYAYVGGDPVSGVDSVDTTAG